MRWWTMAITALGVLLFARPHMSLVVYGGFDPHCFVEQLYGLMGHPYPHCGPNGFFPGIAWIWLPLATLAYGGASLLGVHPHHPVMASILISSATSWAVALACVHRLGKGVGGKKHSALLSLALVTSFPVGYYAFMRPTLVHGPEFALSIGVALLLWERRLGPAILCAALLASLRPQNLWVLIWITSILWEARSKWRLPLAVVSVGAMSWAVAKLSLGHYHHVTLSYLWESLSMEKVARVLGGSDWGLIWTAPWWLWMAFRGLGGTFSVFMSSLVLLGHVLLLASWRGNGGDFAYRYLICTAGPCLWIWANHIKQWNWGEKGLLLINAAWMLWLTWIYRTLPDTFPRTLNPSWPQFVPHFQWTALEGLVSPQQWKAGASLTYPATALCQSWNGCDPSLGIHGTTLTGLTWLLSGLCMVLVFQWWVRPNAR